MVACLAMSKYHSSRYGMGWSFSQYYTFGGHSLLHSLVLRVLISDQSVAEGRRCMWLTTNVATKVVDSI